MLIPVTQVNPAGGSGIGAKLYDYTVTGVDKASIDTGVDDGGSGTAPFPGTYAVLEIWLISRTDEAVVLSQLDFILNNDTGANYNRAIVASSTGGTGFTVQVSTGEAAAVISTTGASASAARPGLIRMTIPAYSGTTFGKVLEFIETVFAGSLGNANREIVLGENYYDSGAPITRIKVQPTTALKKLVVGTRMMIFAR